MPELTIPLNGGYVSSRDRAALVPGELQEATGWRYKPGDGERISTATARSTFGSTGSSAIIKGLALCKYDTGGTDRLLAYSGTVIYSATPGATGTWSSLITGLDSSGVNLGRVHFDDTWYIGNGYDANKAIESDGTVRAMSMQEPSTGLSGSATAVVQSGQRPTATTNSGFSDVTLAYDSTGSYIDTYAYARRSSAGTSTCAWTTFSADAAANRFLYVKWGLAGVPSDEGVRGGERDTKEFNVTVLLEKSEDGGVNWTPLYSKANVTSSISNSTLTSAVTATSSSCQFRATLTYVEGTKAATLKVYDIIIKVGSSAANFSTVDGIYYAYTEYSNTYGIESPYVASPKVTVSSANVVTLTLPSAAVNSTATHWRIYRTTDGGTVPRDLRLIGTAAITETQFIDTFEAYDKDTPGTDTVPLIKIQPDPDSDALYIPANSPAPPLVVMTAYGPFLVGLSPSFPRTLFYSLPGFPEYWPAVYQVTSFPLPERDELVTLATVGDSLLVAAKEAMLVLDGLPEATGGLFQNASARPFLGQPGCVGRQAMVSFSISGEPSAAWVSPFGVHYTNGQVARRISDDLDWETEVDIESLDTAVLQWNPSDATLVFAYDSDGGGVNDRYFVFHMDPVHRKPNGQPKITRGTGDISCMVAGMVSGIHRVYSGHTSSGAVYLDYDNTSAKQIKTARVYGPDMRGMEVRVGRLRHTDFGSSATATVTWSAYDDENGDSQSETETVSLDGQGGTDFWVAMGAEAHECQIDYTGSAAGSLLDIRADYRVRGKAGKS